MPEVVLVPGFTTIWEVNDPPPAKGASSLPSSATSAILAANPLTCTGIPLAISSS